MVGNIVLHVGRQQEDNYTCLFLPQSLQHEHNLSCIDASILYIYLFSLLNLIIQLTCRMQDDRLMLNNVRGG